MRCTYAYIGQIELGTGASFIALEQEAFLSLQFIYICMLRIYQGPAHLHDVH